MARLKNGILGGIHGKLANVVGYSLNGQDIIRTIGKSKKRLTEKQLYNKLKMAVVMDFLSGLDSLIEKGFGPMAEGTTKNYHNLAVAFNNPNALKGICPDVEIDLPKFVFSAGDLPQPEETKVEMVENGLLFTWSKKGFSFPDNQDQVMLFAYAPDTGDKRFKWNGARRFQGQDVLEIPSLLRDKRLEVYISFVSDDRKRAANSLYLGTING
ncbi:DUF6266 family protein [Pedobacter sp. MC2016-24]|uniref:DUF6266 family protein n=1 Tax=Pedobacter sp. MC2016-24 TaxID=2780090 RepID=UPI001881EE14|nr:DUF6266 family protein [Pedobacter sp. MC2016-24]MBE9600158.1 hypothetical protein [Pedobacter sp. MC2016-24]